MVTDSHAPAGSIFYAVNDDFGTQVAHCLLTLNPPIFYTRMLNWASLGRHLLQRPKKCKMPSQVKKEIVLLDSDPNTGSDVGKILVDQPFCITHLQNLAECTAYIKNHACCALILDLDTVDIDNRAIVHLKKNRPKLNIIAKSARRFHPELEESLRNYIFACLTKPLDPSELQFWLRSLTASNSCR
jgi:CheY-like chemotaxis protein